MILKVISIQLLSVAMNRIEGSNINRAQIDEIFKKADSNCKSKDKKTFFAIFTYMYTIM